MDGKLVWQNQNHGIGLYRVQSKENFSNNGNGLLGMFFRWKLNREDQYRIKIFEISKVARMIALG